MITPPRMAISRPVTRYRTAICHPKRPKSMARDLSLTTRVAVRKEQVKPDVLTR